MVGERLLKFRLYSAAKRAAMWGMDTDKQRDTIAEACGWFFLGGRWYMPNGAKATADGGPDLPPDYPADLNAMHEAEKVIKGTHMWGEYKRRLSIICCTGSEFPVDADASQRAEAFLRTIGKWEEA